MTAYLPPEEEERLLKAFRIVAQNGYASEVAAVGYVSTMFYEDEELWQRLSILHRGQKGRTSIMAAAVCSKSSYRLESLLYGLGDDKKKLVDDVDKATGWSALHYACYYGRVDTAAALLDDGATLELGDFRRSTPLHVACWQGRDRMAKELLNEYGANPEARDRDGHRPIHLSAMYGNEKVLELLLAANVNVEAADNQKNTALHLAAKKGHAEAVRILCEAGANLEAVEVYGLTPLQFACKYRHLDTVKELLKAGADPATEAEENIGVVFVGGLRRTTPFDFACADEGIANALLDAGLKNENAGSRPRGITLLHIACWHCSVPIVERLLAAGADPNARYFDNDDDSDDDDNNEPTEIDLGTAPIHHAAGRSPPVGPMLIRLLAHSGADVDALETCPGRTLLQSIARLAWKENAIALLEGGADVNKRGWHGKTALHSVASGKASEERDAVAKHLLDAGAAADVNTQDDKLNTPLHRACRRGLASLSFLLLERGAKLDLPNREGKTPLDLAIESGNKTLATALQERATVLQAEYGGPSAGAGGGKK
jgi:ankyrin repeat protein